MSLKIDTCKTLVSLLDVRHNNIQILEAFFFAQTFKIHYEQRVGTNINIPISTYKE